MMRAMKDGKIARVEELTRIPNDVQDSLITILSEKTLPIPELGAEVQARKGFNVIATSNNRDKGVNELSSALTRRFNIVVLPVPTPSSKKWRSSPSASPSSGARSSSPRRSPRSRRSAASSRSSASSATG